MKNSETYKETFLQKIATFASWKDYQVAEFSEDSDCVSFTLNLKDDQVKKELCANIAYLADDMGLILQDYELFTVSGGKTKVYTTLLKELKAPKQKECCCGCNK